MLNKTEYFLINQCHTEQVLYSNDEVLRGNLGKQTFKQTKRFLIL